jgi:nucleotide-binding universal stress UspA family protein
MTVLIAYDGSEHAKAAIERAGAVLQHGPAVVATAWTTFEGAAPAALLALPGNMVREGTQALDEAGREAAEGLAAEGAELARAAGFDAEARAVRSSGPFFAALLEAADDLDAGVIVAGSRGRSTIAAAVLGSVSTGIVHHARLPVLIVRDGAA